VGLAIQLAFTIGASPQEFDPIPMFKGMKVRPGLLLEMKSDEEIHCEGSNTADLKVLIAESPQILLLSGRIGLAVIKHEDPTPAFLREALSQEMQDKHICQLSHSA
jgi:hypothetical protein